MKVHLRSHLGKFLAITIASIIVISLACILIPKNGDDLQWLKIASVAVPGGMFIVVYLRSYRPSGRLLQMAFPKDFSLGSPAGPVSLHHKITDMLKIIVKRILGTNSLDFRAKADITKRLADETLALTVEALSRGYKTVCFSSVHLRSERKYLMFVTQIKARLPHADVQSILEPTTKLERTLLWLATLMPYNKLPKTHRAVTVSLSKID